MTETTTSSAADATSAAEPAKQSDQAPASAPAAQVKPEPKGKAPAPAKAAAKVKPTPQLKPDRPAKQETGVLSIRSAHGRKRRRAGREFSNEPVEIAIADLTEDELAALQADPQLKIEEA